MSLAGGDVVQYERIKRGSVGDYLIKLDNYIQEIERKVEGQKQHGKRK